MRRTDREITDFNQIVAIIEKSDVCRLAINDGDFPYIVPLNFGMQIENEKIALYFHSALQGTKLDLLRKNNRVSFEMDCGHELVTDESSGNCTMNYESVIGRGTVEFLSDEKKLDGLNILMRQYHKEDFQFNKEVIPLTAVYKLTVSEITGKRREKRL